MIDRRESRQGSSVVLGYSATLAISVVLIGILMMGFGSALDTQEDNAIESELEIAAVQVATEIEKVDATVQSDMSLSNTDFMVTPQFTDRAGDPGFTIHLDSHSDANIYEIRMEVGTYTVTKKFRSITDIDTDARADSTQLEIVYDSSSDEITLQNKDLADIITKTEANEVEGDHVIPSGSEEMPIEATGDVTGGNNADIAGHIEAGGLVNTDDGLSVFDHVDAGSTVTMGQNTLVTNFIEAGGAVDIGSDSTVENDITALGDVTIGMNGLVEGTIDSTNQVTLNDDVTVTGDVLVSQASDITCGTNVMINGQSCSDYKAAEY